ncbi:MAG: cytidylate kinase-like family protein [Deltaproteobacteria bacterium]|nr:cytidylate kinase-like family protein [Deltaproteobacteria bacterium]
MPRNVEEIVNRQVAQWEKERELAFRRRESARPNVVAVSHELKSHGFEIATRAGRLLELPVFDREIVEHIARSARVRLAAVESLDTQVRNRIDEYTTSLLSERNFDRGDYLRHLSRTVATLWEHGSCVLTGHGCVHLVPPEHALRVRIVAPFDLRARRLAADEGVDPAEAARHVRRNDEQRGAFHRRFFGAGIDDLAHFDLVLNTGSLGDDDAAAIVATAYRRKFPGLIVR